MYTPPEDTAAVPTAVVRPPHKGSDSEQQLSPEALQEMMRDKARQLREQTQEQPQ